MRTVPVTPADGNRPDASRMRRVVALAALSVLVVSSAAPAAASLPPPRDRTSVRAMSAQAQAQGGNVTISGWATFSGQIMAGTKDPDDDVDPAVDLLYGAEIIGADFIYRPENEDFFFRLELTKIPVVPIPLQPLVGNVNTRYALRFNAKDIPYEIRAQSFGVDHRFGLFRCGVPLEGMCTEVAELKGGYGTTGERIVVALPLEVLHEDGTDIDEGDPVGVLLAYTANDAYLGGTSAAQVRFDTAQLTRRPEVIVPRKSVRVTVGNRTVRANLNEGYFNARFPARLFRNSPTRVVTRTCLGNQCNRQVFQVRR